MYNEQLRTSCRTRIEIIFPSSSASTSRTKGQSSSSSDSGQSSDPVTTRSHKPDSEGSMQTDPEKPASGNRVVQQTKTRWTRKIQRKAFLTGCSPSQIIWITWRRMCPDIPLRCCKGGDKSEAQYLYSLHQRRNCDVCLRTKITRVLCRRRSEGSIPRTVKFGDLITADHKILIEGSESRNNHRYAVVVQDLATQWIQSSPCKNKNSQETEKSLRKFLEPSQKSKVIYTDNSLECGKSCKELSWNHRTSTHHRSETNGIAERAVR